MTTTVTLTRSEELSRVGDRNAEREALPDLQIRERVDNVHAPVYSRYNKIQKQSISWFVAYCGLLASMSTTSILAAVPEVVETFDTSTTVINTSNALYLVVIGLSCCFWGPMADTFGRKPVYIAASFIFLVASIGTALAPNLVAFFVFRALTGSQSTAFLILGSTCISDIHHPTERATSTGWFLRGTLFGPAFGPLVSGIIVTYTSWRVIFWLQAAMTMVALMLAIFVLRETLQQPRFIQLRGQEFSTGLSAILKESNPIQVFQLLREKNLLCVSIASSAMAFNMYSLLTPIRYILNPRLGLTSPLQAGLLYLAPGGGYLLGSVLGGRWSDYIVKSWSHRRGLRLWEDRLRGSLLLTGLALPGSTLLYGWVVDRGLGGIPLPIVSMFVQAVSQTWAFPCLNTYIMDVMQHKSGKAAASHYFVRYAFAAVATASCIPMIDAIGVGWTATISSALVFLGAGLLLLTVRFGGSWRSRARREN